MGYHRRAFSCAREPRGCTLLPLPWHRRVLGRVRMDWLLGGSSNLIPLSDCHAPALEHRACRSGAGGARETPLRACLYRASGESARRPWPCNRAQGIGYSKAEAPQDARHSLARLTPSSAACPVFGASTHAVGMRFSITMAFWLQFLPGSKNEKGSPARQTRNRPDPAGRACRGSQPLAACVDPGNPAGCFRMSSRSMPPTLRLTAWRHASAQMVSVWWPPSVRTGAGARPEKLRLAAGRNLQRQCHANPLSSDGHSKSETSTHHTLPSPSWAVGFSVAAKKKAGSRSSSYGSAETTAPVREFWPTYVSWGFAGRAVGEPHAATGYRCGPEECGAGAE